MWNLNKSIQLFWVSFYLYCRCHKKQLYYFRLVNIIMEDKLGNNVLNIIRQFSILVMVTQNLIKRNSFRTRAVMSSTSKTRWFDQNPWYHHF